MRVVNKLYLGFLVSFLTCVVYGLYPAAARAAYADGANQTFMVWLTTFGRGFCLVMYCLYFRVPLYREKKHMQIGVANGVLQAISSAGLLFGLFYVPGPLAIVTISTSTVFLLFLYVGRGERRLDLTTALCVIMVLLGLAFAFDVWNAPPVTHWIGIAFLFATSLSIAFRLYIYEGALIGRVPAAVGAENFLVAFVCLLPLALWELPVPPRTFEGWGWAMLNMGSQALGTFGVFYGITMIGSFSWSLLSKIEPLFASLFSVLFLGELLTTSQYAGMVLVIGSLLAYQIYTVRQTRLEGERKAAMASIEG